MADKARGVGKTYRAITALMKASKDCTDAEVVISTVRTWRVLWP